MTIGEGIALGGLIIVTTMLWVVTSEYRRACEAHIESLKLNNERIRLMTELLEALPNPTPQLPSGNTQAERS